uniref:Uncharacterized protein n=1 Tax=Pseudo-nitzschia australis TaxID=44445 RepID=A0A7S4EMY9_9STRA
MNIINQHEEYLTGDSGSEFNLVEPELPPPPPPRLSLKRRTCTGVRHPSTSVPPQISARCITPELLFPVFDEDTVEIIQGVLTPIIDKQIDNTNAFLPLSAYKDDWKETNPTEGCAKKHRTRKLPQILLPFSTSSSVSDCSAALPLSQPQPHDLKIKELTWRLSSIPPLSVALEKNPSVTKATTPTFGGITAFNISGQVRQEFVDSIIAPIHINNSMGDREKPAFATGLSSIPPIYVFFEDDVTPTKSLFPSQLRMAKHGIINKKSL